MIYAAGANLLALYSEKLSEEVAYLPEKTCNAALMTLAGAITHGIVGLFGICRYIRAQISAAQIALVILIIVCVRAVAVISHLRNTASRTVTSADPLFLTGTRKSNNPITVVVTLG